MVKAVLKRPARAPMPPKPCSVPVGDSKYDLLYHDGARGILIEPGREFFGVAYDMALRLSPASAQKLRRWHALPLPLVPEPRHAGYEEASWALGVQAGGFHTTYHRLVGLTLNLVCWTAKGTRVQRRFAVPPSRWHKYHVHHLNWNFLDCRRQNLAPIPIALHVTLTFGQRLPGRLRANPNLRLL